MFREKAKLMKVLTTTVQHFQALTSPVPSPPSSPSSGSQCRSGVKSLPPTQSLTPASISTTTTTTTTSTSYTTSTTSTSTKVSQFLFSPSNPSDRTSIPAYINKIRQREVTRITCRRWPTPTYTPGHQMTSSNISFWPGSRLLDEPDGI